MIVYDDRSQLCRGTEAWQSLADHANPTEGLIGLGIFESAVADALCPERDDFHPLLRRLRAISESLGVAAAAQWRRDIEASAKAAADAMRQRAELAVERWPDLRLKTPEGYAFYSLYPEMYADAVSAWANRVRPARVLCLGLRSIGASLSAIVAGVLRLHGIEVTSWTLRPRGHPFDRRIEWTRDLVAALRPANATVLIVDEGPGLSGSSMTGTADALSSVGVPDEQIVFVPSWSPSPDRFKSRAAAARWPRHELIVPTFDTIRRALAAEGIVTDGTREISGGAWREWLALPQPWPAVHPQHERRKFVDSRIRPGASGGREAMVARFAGLGAYGRHSMERATALADARWAPTPIALRRGFLLSPVVNGRPMSAADVSDEFLRHAAGYVAWLRAHATERSVARTDTLAAMLHANAREAFGDAALGAIALLSRQAATFTEPATRIDGRLMPHEWMVSGAGWIKTDALDHHRDHFFPGCADAAWDVAGLIVEFELEQPSADAVITEYERESGDATIRRRLRFYTAAYTAFRAGYCTMAAEALAQTDEGPRFAERNMYYRAALEATLASARRPAASAR